MSDRKVLHLSHLGDEEYLKHLWTKGEPTDEDVESAVRIESLMVAYNHLLEQIHDIASDEGLAPSVQLTRIRQLTERTRRQQERPVRLQ